MPLSTGDSFCLNKRVCVCVRACVCVRVLLLLLFSASTKPFRKANTCISEIQATGSIPPLLEKSSDVSISIFSHGLYVYYQYW